MLKSIYHGYFTFPSLLYHKFYDASLRMISNIQYGHLPPGIHDVIVCIHGWRGHPNDFQNLIENLQPHTNYKFLTFYLEDITHSILEDSEIIHEYLKPLMPQINKIILIGLSRGGVVSIKCALSMLQNITLTKIITVSSPLNGTYVANKYPFCKNTRRDLSYKSPLTQEIREASKDLSIYSIVPTFDHMIIPTDSAHYPHCKTYFYTGKYSHSGILYAPEVINQIKEWIV
jgi:pimeloyl-ACP methyl ester carboxylesterase